MKYINKYFCFLFIFIGLVSCEIDELQPNLPPVAELPALNGGSADYSKFVSVGASFTAGFTDGALFIAGQENSFPSIMAQQFAGANGGAFTQPLMNDNIGGMVFGGSPLPDGSFGPRLFFNGAGLSTLSATPTTEATTVLTGTFTNMGVPGAKSFHIPFAGYGTLNPYFGRFASSAGTSILADAAGQQPTFFTISEIGGNDVLSYATSGGSGVDQTGNVDATMYGTNDITDPNVFAASLNGIVDALSAAGGDGLIANLPSITDLPHFTTVPHNPLDPTNETFGPLIPTLNTVYGALNDVYAFLQFQGAINDAAARTITFSSSAASAVVINDEDLPDLSAQIAGVLSASPQFAGLLASFGLPTDAGTVGAVAALFGATFGQTRQATAEDLLVLPSSSIIGTVNADVFAFLQSQGLPPAVAGQFAVEGITLPLADKWVLIPSEQTAIKNATDAYNTTIEAVASANPNVALADFKGLLAEASTSGITFLEFTMTTDLVFGGLISLDGVHLTARGYAFMAAVFLDILDENFGSNFIEAGAFPKALDFNTIYAASLQ
jgi:hypothetical protein